MWEEEEEEEEECRERGSEKETPDSGPCQLSLLTLHFFSVRERRERERVCFVSEMVWALCLRDTVTVYKNNGAKCKK